MRTNSEREEQSVVRVTPIPWLRFGLWSFVFAFVLSLPALNFQLQPEYQGIYISAPSDEEHYVAMAREVAEGRPLRSNTYLYEYRDGALNVFQWNEVVVGALLKAWPFGIDWFVWIVRLFSIAGANVLLLALVARLRPGLGRGWWAASAAAWFVGSSILGSQATRFIPRALLGQGGPWREFLDSYRFINPVVTVSVLLGALLVFSYWHEQSTGKRTGLLALLMAAAAYLYIYFWMFLVVYVGIWGISYLTKRDWTRVRQLVWVAIIQGILTIPYWYVTVRFKSFAESLGMSLAVFDRTPVVEKTVVAAVVIYGAWILIKRFGLRRAWDWGDRSLIVLGLTALIAANQHLLSGHRVEPHHFYFMTDLPAASLLLVVAIGEIAVCLHERIGKWAGMFVAVVVVLMGFGVQRTTVASVGPAYQDLQRWAAAFREIDRYPDPIVVYADARIAELVPMYTHAYVSYAQHAAAYLTTPGERTRWAYYVASYLGGLRDKAKARSTFEKDRDYIGAQYLYRAQQYRERCGSPGCFPDQELESMAAEYQTFLEKDFETEWFRYRLDLIAWDEKRHPEWQLEQFPFLAKVWSSDEISFWHRR